MTDRLPAHITEDDVRLITKIVFPVIAGEVLRDLASRVASENPGVSKVTAENWARWIRAHIVEASPDTASMTRCKRR